MSKPVFVYVIYIAASPERVWEALTKADVSERFWFGYRVPALHSASPDQRSGYRCDGLYTRGARPSR